MYQYHPVVWIMSSLFRNQRFGPTYAQVKISQAILQASYEFIFFLKGFRGHRRVLQRQQEGLFGRLRHGDRDRGDDGVEVLRDGAQHDGRRLLRGIISLIYILLLIYYLMLILIYQYNIISFFEVVNQHGAPIPQGGRGCIQFITQYQV